MEFHALPRGWGKRLHHKADLAASLAELEGMEHFFAESQRGRLRCLMGRFREAGDSFHRASFNIARASNTAQNLLMAILHLAYCREYALANGRVHDRLPPAPVQRAAGRGPWVRIIAAHRTLDAEEALHEGEPEEARSIFAELVEDESASPETKTLWHVGLAAAECNLNRRAEAFERLEIAGLHLATVSRTFGRVQCAARISAVYRCLDRAREADAWIRFLCAQRCPLDTKRAMIHLWDRIATRSQTLGRVVLV